MKLWLLKPAPDTLDKMPDYNVMLECVVRAETEQEARNFVAVNAGDEGKDVWLNRRFSLCEELLKRGEPGLIVVNFQSG